VLGEGPIHYLPHLCRASCSTFQLAHWLHQTVHCPLFLEATAGGWSTWAKYMLSLGFCHRRERGGREEGEEMGRRGGGEGEEGRRGGGRERAEYMHTHIGAQHFIKDFF